MKYLVGLLALAVSSCAAFGSNTPKSSARQVRLNEITTMAQNLTNQYLVPELTKQTPTGRFEYGEAILTTNLVYGVVKMIAYNKNGHLADLYFNIACEGPCDVVGLYPVWDPAAQERMVEVK